MPSSRRLKVTGLAALLTLCIIFYVSNGAQSTRTSPFYTRTAAVLADRTEAAAREALLVEEKQRLDRVDRVEKEHKAAMEAAAADADVLPPSQQKPIAVGSETHSVAGPRTSEKSVAGRKMMKDGKVVEGRPASDTNDGVAKVGNVAPKMSAHVVSSGGDGGVEGEGPTADERAVDVALNEILRKGPIIIFSKTYCPFSKKAKHILLDLYTINPPPYVVELDQHDLGAGLQNALEKKTGRRTVPNVLINGKSIGGGDDVEALHTSDKLIDTVSSMGGKRIVKVAKAEWEKKTEMMFRS